MTELDLQSEQYQPTGSMAGRGVRRQLGSPDMDPLALLVREAAQNSWDARLEDAQRIRFGIDVHTFGPDQLNVLRNEVFADRPPNLSFQLLESDRVAAISVFDRGTAGLGGPTRANQVSDVEDPPRDFVDFLRNVGQPPDKDRGGGTYGYGKAVFYMLSSLRTVCVHTRPVTGESRFMAAALGDEYTRREEDGGRMYTGRHWWGEKQRDGIVDPVTARTAVQLARRIGMPAFTGPGESGTTITVLAPDLGEKAPGRSRSLRDAAVFMGEVLLWFLWPKMIDTSPCMVDSEVRLQGKKLPLPAPEDYPPLKGFVSAMRAVTRYREDGRTSADVDLEEIEHGLYNHRLGVAGFRVAPRLLRPPIMEGREPSFLPVGDPSHHVALLRSPELVVKYLAGPELPSEMLEYCGVFRVDDGRDRSFAESEPPAHDDWVVDAVEDRKRRSNVRVALRKLKELMDRLVEPHLDPKEGGPVMPLGAFARSLGSLLPTSGSGGGEVGSRPRGRGGSPGNRGGGGHRRSTSRVVATEDPEPDTIDGEPVIRFHFQVHHPENCEASRVEARPLVALDDGTTVERDPPQGTELPRIVGWSGPSGEFRSPEDSIEIPNSEGTWSVILSVPEDAAVGVDLTAEPLREE